MKGIVGILVFILLVYVAVKLLGLALKIAGILIVVAFLIFGYRVAQRMLKGPGRA